MSLYKDYKFFDKKIKVIAHRGDSKFYPENSSLAFQSAVDLGVDIIETDVHISVDGVIFVWHDEDTWQLDGNKSKVSTRTWSDLCELDLGFLYIDKSGKRPFSSKNIKLMTFEDVLINFPDTRFNVDLKDKDNKLVKGMYNLLEKYDAFDRVVVASFHSENLKSIRKISNRVATSYGRSEVRLRVVLTKLKLFRFISRFLKKPPVMQVPVTSNGTLVVTRYFIKVLHKRGIKIQVWTINSEYEMRRLFKLGVDGVMTDDPRLLIKVVNELKSDSL